MNTEKSTKMIGSILGGIVGDAFGSPYQFMPRDRYTITAELEECENFGMPPGAFTDDSSMMLCLAESLAVCDGFDAADQMERYHRWLTQGYMSSAAYAFDIGQTTRLSIGAYGRDRAKENDIPIPFKGYGLTAESSSGNGGIMRLAPVPVYFHDEYAAAIKYARLSSAVTHASPECLDCAALLAHVIHRLLNGATKTEALDTAKFEAEVTTPKVKDLCRGTYKHKTRAQISTAGYVVDSLEAALWMLHRTDSYEAGILALATMGNDVDTVCSIFGQMAGALWGVDAIPTRWLDGIQRFHMVLRTANSLVDSAFSK
jgi:ADP-ribosyl-[dinitrogen reductase] hydrolase